MLEMDALENVKDLQKFAEDNHYDGLVKLPSGEWVCIHKYAFTYAILSGLNLCGYEDRWCYGTYIEALQGLCTWAVQGGRGEPEGWHRHPTTGRRRPDGDKQKEYICL